jgi:hypothetical protein
LVAAFGAVAYEELLGCGQWGGEFDEAALAPSFHCFFFGCVYECGRRFGFVEECVLYFEDRLNKSIVEYRVDSIDDCRGNC